MTGPLAYGASSTPIDRKTEEIFKIPTVLEKAGDQYKYYLNTLRFNSFRLDPMVIALTGPPRTDWIGRSTCPKGI